MGDEPGRLKRVGMARCAVRAAFSGAAWGEVKVAGTRSGR
jgi:hypothetical protein